MSEVNERVTTTHYNMIKPQYNETADIGDINNNMDTIDGLIYGIKNVGSTNAGKFMVVASDGTVTPTTVPFANGGTY